MRRGKSQYFYLASTFLGLYIISTQINRIDRVIQVGPEEWRKPYGSGPDSLLIPRAINYVQNDEKLKTVIRHNYPPVDPPIPLDENNSKLILFYTLNYGVNFVEKSWNWTTDGTFDYPDSVFKCPKKCKTTQDKNLVKDAHAVVFSIIDSLYKYNVNPSEADYPELESRNQNQIWVATTIEAPLYHFAQALGRLGHLFNWTYTYRLDSDVYLPYGYFYKLETPKSLSEIQLPDIQTLRTKKLAVSLISNCRARSKRDAVIAEMKKYVAVDSFGKCGGNQCPAVPDCREWLAGRYKFFLAFENSLCQDYITEKFFHPFEVGLVPVTYGLGDYAEVAPPHSYINALDFPTVKALTDYLGYLDQNDEEYLKYFHWKQEYGLGPRGFAAQVCSLCMKLWEPKEFTQEITNFNDWWNHKRTPQISIQSSESTVGETFLRDAKSACVGPKDIFHQVNLA